MSMTSSRREKSARRKKSVNVINVLPPPMIKQTEHWKSVYDRHGKLDKSKLKYSLNDLFEVSYF